MAATSNDLIQEALTLPQEERAEIAAAIWASISPDGQEISDNELLELTNERQNEINSGKVTPIKHEELLNSLGR